MAAQRTRVLALSGGGAHATSYIGAWKYIHDEKGYTPDIVTGTSGGALFGVFMAAGLDAETIEQEMLDAEPWRFFRPAPLRKGLNVVRSWGEVDVERVRRAVAGILERHNVDWDAFTDTAFQCVVTDINDTERKYVPRDVEMDLDAAVTASLAIPFVFTPLWHQTGKEKHCYVDGGVTEGFPIRAALEAGRGNVQIMALSPFAPHEHVQHAIDSPLEYVLGLYHALLDGKKADMMTLLSEEDGDVFFTTGSHARRVTDFSPDAIRRNVRLGYNEAREQEARIDAFFG
ncbi:MAG: patatin-like phospholipase family protein [Candidatus Thermoplasmatota archaeon]|nr:patatin-like phospholipase family protein [Candidatus Thermoplasmatota archaeon]